MGSKRKRNAKESHGSHQPSAKKPKNQAAATNGSVSSTTLDKSPFTEEPHGEERKREAFLYELLGSEDSNDRLNAADAILSGLLGGEGVSEPVLQRHLDWRLFRGLASGRNASRLGFSVVITEILRQLYGEERLADTRYPSLHFDKVVSKLVERTQPVGNLTGQEERDYYFGRIFGIECFVRAGVLFDNEDRWFSLLQLLLDLANKKVWLRSQAGWIVVQALQHMDAELAEKTLRKVADQGLAKTPEGVGMWIVALDRFPDLRVPAKTWRHPLSPKTFGDLSTALKDGGREATPSGDAGGRKQKQSNWTAQLHFVWDLVLAHFVKLPSKDPGSADQFKQFWNRVVDETFFAKSASESQKFSGFMIFQKMVEGGEKAPFILENVFSKNLMVCLMNQAAKEDRYLHRAALKALKTIETAVQQNPSLLPLVLRQLLGPRGAYNFDLRTNTKTVDKLLQSTNSENAGEVLEILKGCNNLEASQSLQTYSGYLSRIASLPTDVELADGETRVPAAVRALQEMSKLTYSKAGSDAVAGKIRDMLRSKLTAAFAKLVRRPEDFAHLCRAVLSIKADHDMDEEIESELRRASERLADLLDREHVELGLRAPYQGLALLHAVGILQLHNEEPDAVDTLADLDQCYEKLKSNALKDDDGISEFLVEILLSMVAQPSSLMRQVSQQVFEAFTPLLSEQAIQLLLDPLEAEESSKGQQALFSTEDEDMNGDGEEGSDGSDPESLDSDVEMVDIEGAPSEDGSEGTDDSSDEAEEEEEEEEDGDKEEMQAFDDALAKVLKTRRLDAQDQEAAAAADDSDSDSDSDMSDSEMMALDDKIAEVFRQRTKQARKGRDRRDAKASVVNFKHRVLDLLAIFVRREAASANPLVFRVLLPLLRLVRTTTVRPLAGKACELVLTFGKSLKKARSVGAEQDKAKKEQEEQEQAQSGKEKDKKKKKKKDKKDKNKKSQEEDVGGKAGLDADDLLALLAEIHTEAALDQSHVLARAASAASLAVASVLLDGTGPWTAVARQGIDEDVFRLYAGTQLRWFRGEIKMQASFFSDWLNWCQSHASASAAKTAAVKE